jgi:RimJ/RimL family protein N-acetyltransferase
MHTTQVLQTARLELRHLERADAPFILGLLNEPSWLRHIGDKHVRTLGDAERYIEEGPITMYARLGFGLYLVESRHDGEPMGLCGLIKRETLDDVDLGFAFVPRCWGQGYAYEAAAAVISYARRSLGIGRIVAITSPDNDASGRLLRRLGFALGNQVVRTNLGQNLLFFSLNIELSAADELP